MYRQTVSNYIFYGFKMYGIKLFKLKLTNQNSPILKIKFKISYTVDELTRRESGALYGSNPDTAKRPFPTTSAGRGAH